MNIDYSEIRLNPEDVLNHLQQLGYNNISQQQLREFMRDLKKLIKYDLKKQKENTSCTSHETNSCKESTSLNSTEDSYDGQRQPFSERNTFETSESRNSSINTVTYTGSSSCFSESSSGNSSETLSQLENRPSRHPKKKPRPSFIRPREIGTQGGPPRSDPVALYHYYQKFWQHFKQPGEDEHRELRWNIRERMLGRSQESTQFSRASSRSSLKRL